MNDGSNARRELLEGNDRVAQAVGNPIQRVENLIAEALLAYLIKHLYAPGGELTRNGTFVSCAFSVF